MSLPAWIACSLSIALAFASAAHGLLRGSSAGRARLVLVRLKSPTVYLFSAYLLVAALVTPRTSGETASPLLGLAVVLPIGYALATLASLADERPRLARSLGRALLHGGAVFGAAAIVLALASPDFVPAWLR